MSINKLDEIIEKINKILEEYQVEEEQRQAIAEMLIHSKSRGSKVNLITSDVEISNQPIL